MKNGLFFGPILIGSLILSSYALSQQTATMTSSPLQASLSAMVGHATIQDVTLTGTAEVIAGSTDESVPVTLRSLSGGSSRIDLSLAAGVMTDVRIMGANAALPPTGTWTSGNGVQHLIAQQNEMTDSGWFFPALLIQRTISNPARTVVFVGQEGNLLHYQSYQQSQSTAVNASPTLQHLTQMDIYLESKTLLPTQLAFNIHPDNNATVDMPVLIQFQDYQTVNGILLPFQVQESVNGSLTLDIQIQTAALNSGLTTSTLSAQ